MSTSTRKMTISVRPNRLSFRPSCRNLKMSRSATKHCCSEIFLLESGGHSPQLWLISRSVQHPSTKVILLNWPQLLNSFSGNSDIDSISFFAEYADNSAAFSRKLDILLTWGVTPLQFGDHRGYVAATLLQSYRDREEQRAIRRGREPDDFLQDQLFDWLDCSEAAGEAVHLSSVALLFGQLVKRGIFSYSQYIQRLIARGEPNLLVTEV